ncbi:hypothetical protein [Paraburkholderia caribensis]|uniref:hypothetical protein n=1 Tax=Paraburkholderia caribensis TaxID=75105 RepID=UPI001CAF6DD5|nr:hypothetical protein [Paraburkholderia caribensis]CAG9255925.1 conserved hypothetical protein [Paraburkholderia caribensis]
MKITGAAPLTAFQLAGNLPRNAQFRAFVAHCTGVTDVDDEFAAAFIRMKCGIETRRVLETNERAEKAFHDFIRRPFVAWKERQHVAA